MKTKGGIGKERVRIYYKVKREIYIVTDTCQGSVRGLRGEGRGGKIKAGKGEGGG